MTILKYTAFDSIFSLQQINDQNISSIEEYIRENPQVLQELSCCRCIAYRDQSKFTLLPGHRCSLLNLKNAITNSKGSSKKKQSTEAIEEINESEEKQILLDRLVNFTASIYLEECYFVSNDISVSRETMQDGKQVRQCKVRCPICNKVYSSKFNGHWRLSNIFGHLKTHCVHAGSIEYNESDSELTNAASTESVDLPEKNSITEELTKQLMSD